MTISYDIGGSHIHTLTPAECTEVELLVASGSSGDDSRETVNSFTIVDKADGQPLLQVSGSSSGLGAKRVTVVPAGVFSSDLTVVGNHPVTGNLGVGGTASVVGDVSVGGTLCVTGTTIHNGTVFMGTQVLSTSAGPSTNSTVGADSSGLLVNYQAGSQVRFRSNNASVVTLEQDGMTQYRPDRFIGTQTAVGVNGNKTINKPCGTINIASGSTSVIVTNSMCTASGTLAYAFPMTAGGPAVLSVVPADGAFTIRTAGGAADCTYGWLLTYISNASA